MLQERADLLNSNRGEMQELFDKRSRLEQEFMDRYLATVEHYQQQLEALRIADAEDYHILKIRWGMTRGDFREKEGRGWAVSSNSRGCWAWEGCDLHVFATHKGLQCFECRGQHYD